MTSGQGYIETRNASLVPLLTDDRPTTGKRGYPIGIRSTERYAMISEVYGPFREDSMELKEERAYQRGMMKHIRERMEGLQKMNLIQEIHDPQSRYGMDDYNTDTRRLEKNYNAEDPAGQWDPGRRERVESRLDSETKWHGGESLGQSGEKVREISVWEDLSSLYRPKTTYYELARQKTSTKLRPVPPPPKTYTEMLNQPNTYTDMMLRAVEDFNRPSHRATNQFSGWRPQGGVSSEEYWDNNSSVLTNHGPVISKSFEPATRVPPILGNETRLPFLNAVQYGQTAFYRNHDNRVNNGKLSVDINLNMLPSDGGQMKYGNVSTANGGTVHHPLVPQLSLTNSHPTNQARTLTEREIPSASARCPSGATYLSFRQPMTDRPDSGTDPIYPYRSMNNPWFPKEDPRFPPPPPSIRQHYRKGKYGYYRVFDVNDYKKLTKEMRLGSIVGGVKDMETNEEKKEKKAITQEYGRLVRAKNREEMRPNYIM